MSNYDMLTVVTILSKASMHFEKDRLSFGLYGLYPKYRCYIKPLSYLFHLLGTQLVVKQLAIDDGMPSVESLNREGEIMLFIFLHLLLSSEFFSSYSISFFFLYFSHNSWQYFILNSNSLWKQLKTLFNPWICPINPVALQATANWIQQLSDQAGGYTVFVYLF